MRSIRRWSISWPTSRIRLRPSLLQTHHAARGPCVAPAPPFSVPRGTLAPTPTVTARRSLRRIPSTFTARSPLPASPLLPRSTPRPTSARLRLPGLPSTQGRPHTPDDHSTTAMRSARRRGSLSTTASPSPAPSAAILIIAIRASGSTPTPLMHGTPGVYHYPRIVKPHACISAQ
ncbi:hypothetical protein B0H13DRAFT_2345756 [Mycena leptocephala]|nr:hypothetical protein B0H13DRAFT_2345756 [Mycena leptocephala]